MSWIGDFFSDGLGLKPVEDVGDWFQDAASWVTAGMYNARDNRFSSGVGENLAGALFHSPSDVAEADAAITGGLASGSETGYSLSDWFRDIAETDEEAARLQAERNETAAQLAWERSEVAANNAMERARELRRTSYQDAVDSLIAAGLNPVLAASGGISGSSTTAPQANAPASSSSKSEGLNLASLLQAIASIMTGAGNLISGLNPLKSLTEISDTGGLTRKMYQYGR